MKIKRIYTLFAIILLIIFFSLTLNVSGQSFDYKKAYKLYLQVEKKEKKFIELTLDEQKQVIKMQKILLGNNVTPKKNCKKEKKQAMLASEELIFHLKKLIRCADNKTLTYDCLKEFRKIQSSFYNYQAKISTVSSECN